MPTVGFGRQLPRVGGVPAARHPRRPHRPRPPLRTHLLHRVRLQHRRPVGAQARDRWLHGVGASIQGCLRCAAVGDLQRPGPSPSARGLCHWQDSPNHRIPHSHPGPGPSSRSPRCRYKTEHAPCPNPPGCPLARPVLARMAKNEDSSSSNWANPAVEGDLRRLSCRGDVAELIPDENQYHHAAKEAEPVGRGDPHGAGQDRSKP